MARLTRQQLVDLVLEAAPQQASYLEPHHERFETSYEFAHGLPTGQGVAADVGGSGGLFLPILHHLGWRELHAVDLGDDPRPRPLRFSVRGEPVTATRHDCDIERQPLPFADAALDFVSFLEVIEHLTADPMFPLLEFHRVLRPGGYALVTTPNVGSAGSLLRLLRGQHPGHFPPYRPQSDHRHHREFMPQEVQLLLQNAGFEVVALVTRPAGRSSVRWLVRVLRWLGRARVPDGMLGENIYAIARKPVDGPHVVAADLPPERRYPAPVYLR